MILLFADGLADREGRSRRRRVLDILFTVFGSDRVHRDRLRTRHDRVMVLLKEPDFQSAVLAYYRIRHASQDRDYRTTHDGFRDLVDTWGRP